MDSSSAHWENYWQIPPPLSPLLLIFCFSETRPAQQHTPHRSAPAHTPTCRTKKLASTPPELAGAQPAAPAPRAPRPAGQRLGPRLGGRGAPGVPISHRGAPRPLEQGRCDLHRARSRDAHRAGSWAAARAGAGRLQGGAAKWPWARSAICGSCSGPRSRPSLQPHADTCTGHWAQQSWWSPAPGARRRAPRSATPFSHAVVPLSGQNCPLAGKKRSVEPYYLH
jgi:hypothetical protein